MNHHPESSLITPASADAFGPHVLPFGVFSTADRSPRIGVRLHESVLDLVVLSERDGLDLRELFDCGSLDRLLAAGPAVWVRAREATLRWAAELEDSPTDHAIIPLAKVQMHLPFTVADFVDFFSSREHVENMSRILRPGQPLLQPNWLRIPVAYHGRAASVVVSGTTVTRPWGVLPPQGEDAPAFGPTQRLDVEVELGFVVGVGSEPGATIPVNQFREHVFGVVLVNDWSARDIQAFEAVPLGAFLGKSFATSIGAWVLPLDALESSRVAPPERVHEPEAYLRSTEEWGLDIDFELTLNGTVISRPSFAGMYWTPDQQLAHMTVNGAAARTGDLYASGTISAGLPENFGSLVELSRAGTQSIVLNDGASRTFLEDGDTVSITAVARGAGGQAIGLGDVSGTITGWNHPVNKEPMK